MPTTYTQRQATAQKRDASNAASVKDYSSQNEYLQRKADLVNDVALHSETLQCFTVSATLLSSLKDFDVPDDLIGAIMANQGNAKQNSKYGWTRFTHNGYPVYHVTNGHEGVTVFYCQDAKKNAEVLGIGFHRDDKKMRTKYGTPLYYLDKFVCGKNKWVGLSGGSAYKTKNIEWGER